MDQPRSLAPSRARSGGRATAIPPARELVRLWPWVAAVVAAALTNLLIGGARHFDYHGIDGFSTTNYGWLAFALVGGIVFAWRLARRPITAIGLLRPMLAAIVAYVSCFLLVTLSGVVFLPDQPVQVTMTTDAAGRSLPVAMLVLIVAVVLEIVRMIVRRVRR